MFCRSLTRKLATAREGCQIATYLDLHLIIIKKLLYHISFDLNWSNHVFNKINMSTLPRLALWGLAALVHAFIISASFFLYMDLAGKVNLIYVRFVFYKMFRLTTQTQFLKNHMIEKYSGYQGYQGGWWFWKLPRISDFCCCPHCL